MAYKKIVTLRWTHFVKFLRWERVQKRHIWYCMAGKVENKKLEVSENEDNYLLWWSDKQHFPYSSLGLSGEDNSVSRTDNFVIVNVFNCVTSSRVTGNRNFARKEELIYEIIAVLTSNTTCPMPAILGDFTKWHLWRLNTIPFMHRDRLVGNRYFVPFFVFYTESTMLGPRFIHESIFYTQPVIL